MELKINSQKMNGKLLVIKVIGEMDVYTSPGFRLAMSRQIECGEHKILLDISELKYLDSTGLGAIAECLEKLQRCGGDLRFLYPTPIFLKLLKLSGLSDSCIIYHNLQEARTGWMRYSKGRQGYRKDTWKISDEQRFVPRIA